MVTSTSDEIRIGRLAIRFLLESEVVGRLRGIFAFDVPPGTNLSIARR